MWPGLLFGLVEERETMADYSRGRRRKGRIELRV